MIKLEDIKAIQNEEGLSAEFRVEASKKWNNVVSQIQHIPTVYTEYQIDYQHAYFKEIYPNLLNVSLVIFNGKYPCGIWPLSIISHSTDPIRSVSNQYGDIVIPPLFIDNFPKKSQRKVIKSCINFLNKLLELCKGEFWRASAFSTEISLSQWYQISLEKGGALSRVDYEMYVDLSMTIEEIRKFIRKSYRPLVSSGLKKWKVLVLDYYCEDIWTRFRELHRAVSGRVTRPLETWNLQHDAIKTKQAFLVYILNENGDMVGGGLFDIGKNESSYAVGVYDRNLSDQPLGHLIQYRAIEEMLKRNLRWYYIGPRFYKEELPFVTEKQVNISSFKQGFSSHLFPRIGLIFSKSLIKNENN